MASLKTKIFSIFFAFITINLAFSQAKTDSARHRIHVPQKDIGDVYHSIFHRHKPVDSAKKADKKFYISILPAAGYTLQTGFAGVVSANIGFYESKDPDQKISNINTSFTYSQYKQILLPLYASIWTNKNKWNLISDFKYLDYPSDIYGLGGKRITVDANSNVGYTIDFKSVKLHQSVLRKINDNLYAGGGFYYDQFWGIKATDSLGRRVEHIINRRLGTSERAVGVAVRALYDSRLNQINPNNGFYANVVYRPNFTFLGSQKNWASLLIDTRKYFKFPANSDNVLAFWGFAWLTASKTVPPYFLQPAVGWDDQYNTARGYIQGRFRGKNMLYYENEYRFKILRNGLIGGVAFANVSTFAGNLSPEYEKALIGYGAGLRIKLNKKSGTNLALDYAFGKQNSRGFFVNLGEVF